MAPHHPWTARRVTVLVALAVSLAAVAVAPALMPASYSWLAHTTSESAAQGVRHAWVTRAGFALFGAAVLLLALPPQGPWRGPPRALHATFGALMVAVAVFSSKPWQPNVPFDAAEDGLHSIAASAMGFAFAIGVVATAIRIWNSKGRLRARDAIAVVSSVAIPPAMMGMADQAGLLQRSMFLVAYLWYASESAERELPQRIEPTQ